MDNRLFLIDGHALIFRMYYAFLRRPMINSKGADMSILFGFTKYILELIEKEKPTHLAILLSASRKAVGSSRSISLAFRINAAEMQAF